MTVWRPSIPPLARTVAAVATAGALGLLMASAVLGPAASAAGATSPSAQAKYEAAIQAVGHQGVHFDSTASQGNVTIEVTGDTGATTGMQKLVVQNGSVTEVVTAMVVGSTGYINANSAALHHVIGLTNAQSSKYAGKWLSFPTSNNGLNELITGLLNSQVSSELQMSGPYRYAAPATIAGQRVLAIRGSETTQGGGNVPTTLYVRATGTPLPVQEVTNPGHSGGKSAIHGTVTFSHWGEGTNEHAPAHAVSLLKIVPTASGSATTKG